MLAQSSGLRLGLSRAWLAGLLAAAAWLATGCAAWDRPPVEESMPEESRSTSGLRPAGPEGQIMGIDERARQIERNLGLR